MMADDAIIVRLHPRWTDACKDCGRPVQFRKAPDGALIKFDADPAVLSTFAEPGGGPVLQRVAAADLHRPLCPAVDHSLFDQHEASR